MHTPRWNFAVSFAAIATATAASWLSWSDGSKSPTPRSDAATKSSSPALEPLRYDRDIRPILSDKCFRCHGHDSAKRRGNLRLDERESATCERDGGAAIVPGSADKSELWRRIVSTNDDDRMPEPSSNKPPLSDDERALIKRWIDEGAKYEPHWSFVAPVKPAVPQLRDAKWARNEIDRFIEAKLETNGFSPSSEAPRDVLLRRVFLDLTGLPPTPEELDQFLADTRPDAYERWVDKLLEEEPYATRYAERMTQPWLDAARYADTCGIHTDAGRQMWAWRDWVLKAYHDNYPFDRFLTEQIAGDLLPNATDDQRVASGFNRNHVTTDEGGAIADEYLVEYAVDRTATTGSVFLGLTLGCARCHEHKFDPISQDEFYRFYAFFNSIEEPGLYSQLPDSNRAFEPFMAVPSAEQRAKISELEAKSASEKQALDAPAPEEDAQRTKFLADEIAHDGVQWAKSELVAATSTGGSTLTIQPDGSVLASGENPKQDEHVVTLRTHAKDLRILSLEALADPSFPNGRVGRAFNGNAVVSGVEVEAKSMRDPTQHRSIRFGWAWADWEQDNGDFTAVNLLDTKDMLGWAVDGHRREGNRSVLLLADDPFGYDGGTELEIKVQYKSGYEFHNLGRIRLTVGSIAEPGLAHLPAAASSWYLVGPFPNEDTKALYDTKFGPEESSEIDFTKNFGSGNQMWRYVDNLRDGQLNTTLPTDRNATYVGKRIFSPTARTVDVSLGSDDGFALFLNGAQVASKMVDRAVAADQDKAKLELRAGVNTLVFKIINTGGIGGFYFKAERRADELAGDLVAAIVPDAARYADLAARLERAWRVNFSPGYRERTEHIAALDMELAKVKGEIPLTMVMKELPKERDTFALTRGQYDHPDKNRPVTRGVPEALGKLPDGAPLDRLGLAQWMTSSENPLVARVAVNRLWELVFGTGIVRTSEDFGQQGEFPSHPELLDWLAVDFRENGWDVKRMVKRLVTSSTYRQSSKARADVREHDPEDRWLAWFPRRRLTAEQIRDQALYVSGLLVEKTGGPSVKPYQPDGLWQEVAMPASNTRFYVRGEGDQLWRRSIYTYWKRACPPPSLMTFDAPTREFCTIRRPSTDTPLQALVIWNDEQFVEAARVLAERVLDVQGGDRERLTSLYRRCTARRPNESELALLTKTLGEFRERYRAAPDDAKKLIAIGMKPAKPELEPVELAAWTLVASALFDLDATICQG